MKEREEITPTLTSTSTHFQLENDTHLLDTTLSSREDETTNVDERKRETDHPQQRGKK